MIKGSVLQEFIEKCKTAIPHKANEYTTVIVERFNTIYLVLGFPDIDKKKFQIITYDEIPKKILIELKKGKTIFKAKVEFNESGVTILKWK